MKIWESWLPLSKVGQTSRWKYLHHNHRVLSLCLDLLPLLWGLQPESHSQQLHVRIAKHQAGRPTETERREEEFITWKKQKMEKDLQKREKVQNTVQPVTAPASGECFCFLLLVFHKTLGLSCCHGNQVRSQCSGRCWDTPSPSGRWTMAAGFPSTELHPSQSWRFWRLSWDVSTFRRRADFIHFSDHCNIF